MTISSNTPGSEEPKSRWSGIGKFLFIVALVIIFYLLGQSMVHHRFFQGGRVHRNGSIGQ
jgi:hypothetical protein